MRSTRTVARVLLGVLGLCGVAHGAAVATPAELYKELFVDVQLGGVFADSKTFVDALPARPPKQVLSEYRKAKTRPGFDLRKFVAGRFTVPRPEPTGYRTAPGQDVRAHIDRLWSVLERKPDDQRPYSSRLALPKPYVVPGGRFNEIYYWDSFFTMLGLEASGRHDLTAAMVQNFAWLIDRYGHVPNGNRSYYLSRSQPPFFAAMVELLAEREGKAAYVRYLPQLKREYAFWMEGAAGLDPGSAHRRVVRLGDGAILNRYWDDRATPRQEAYREDIATARASTRPAAEVYRNLRAAAESGWDFSSRWLADGQSLPTVRTTELIPPDLNSLLYRLERTIEQACRIAEDAACVKNMRVRADARSAAIERYLWNSDAGAFTDYDWKARRKGTQVTAATLYPLYFEVSGRQHARTVAATVRSTLLRPHGLATTAVRSGQQWDAPNGWAPLHWIAVVGLRNYGQQRLAAVIAERWITTNVQTFRRTGKLFEKYDISGSGRGRGGEYPLQDGFGWTNGVLRTLLQMLPKVAAGLERAPASQPPR